MKRIAIRVDASTIMGSGHLFRCLTLADALKKEGVQIHFLCRDLEGFDPSLITSKGHIFHSIQTVRRDKVLPAITDELPHSRWLPCSQQQDYLDCANILDSLSPFSWIIVDHYALDMRWEELAQRHTSYLMTIDDLADRYHLCDLLLDQNCYPDMSVRYTSLVPEYCNFLIGPRYSLLRPEFVGERNKRPRQQSQIRRIFVFFGGSDLTNETQKTLDSLALLNKSDIQIDVVIGTSNPHSESLLKKSQLMKQVDTYRYISNMAKMMSLADIVIGAGGSTNWERFCLGVPSLVTSVAHNQIDSCRYLAKENLIIYLGHHTDVTVQSICDMILHLENNSYILKEISDSSKKMVDGLGVKRVLNELIGAI